MHRFGGKSCQAKATPGAHRSNLVNFMSEQQTCKSPSKGTSKVPGSELDVVTRKMKQDSCSEGTQSNGEGRHPRLGVPCWR